MSEVQPFITYSSEGILTVARGEPETIVEPGECGLSATRNNQLERARNVAIDELGRMSGATVEERDGTTYVQVHAETALEDDLFSCNRDRVSSLLASLAPLLPTEREASATDRVLVPTRLSERDVRADVYQHFQAWLNRADITERIVLDCLRAMAMPFGQAERVEEDFSFTEFDGATQGIFGDLEVLIRPETFEFRQRANGRIYAGTDTWQTIRLRTYGRDVPIIDRAANARRPVAITADNKRLYTVQSANVDRSRQACSMLFGLGSLAHAAANFSGSIDMLTGAAQLKPHNSIFAALQARRRS